MSRAPTSPRRSRKQRDRTVGRRRASWSAQSRIVTPAGGSSRVLSRADWASSFIRSALSMMATRAPPSTGMSSSSPTRSLTPRYFASGPPMTTWRPGPAGPRRWRSGWLPCSTSRHARHVRHGRASTAAVHNSPAAMSSARVVLPTPSGPTRRTAWGTGPRIIVAAAASAAACPRVRAPSMNLSVRPVRLAPWSCASCAASVRSRSRRRSRSPWLASPSRPPACGSHAAWPEPSPRAPRRRHRSTRRRGRRRLPRSARLGGSLGRMSRVPEDAEVLRGARALAGAGSPVSTGAASDITLGSSV